MQQRVIGLIGGMSWESSAEYYRIINQAVRSRLGGVHSARVLMWSFDFGEIEALQHAEAAVERALSPPGHTACLESSATLTASFRGAVA